MKIPRESDSPIISEKPSNKTGDNKAVAEKVEKSEQWDALSKFNIMKKHGCQAYTVDNKATCIS